MSTLRVLDSCSSQGPDRCLKAQLLSFGSGLGPDRQFEEVKVLGRPRLDIGVESSNRDVFLFPCPDRPEGSQPTEGYPKIHAFAEEFSLFPIENGTNVRPFHNHGIYQAGLQFQDS